MGKIERLLLFFVVCCVGGIAVLVCTFSPTINPGFLNESLFKHDVTFGERVDLLYTIHLTRPNVEGTYKKVFLKSKGISHGDFALLGLPEC